MQPIDLKPLPVKELKRYPKDFFKKNKVNMDLLDTLKQQDYVTYDDGYYFFKYVGIILVENRVIHCYPKYLSQMEDKELFKKFKQVLQVIRKYNKTENVDYDYIESNQTATNLLPLMLFFIEDYYEHGIYTNYKNVHQINGNGEINWDRTINNYNPMIIKNKPYYMELETKYNKEDIYDIFRQLHKCIITQCSKKLEKTGLLNLFDLTPVDISDKSLNSFFSQGILKRLEQEQKVEFNTHKQKLLRYMYAILKEEDLLGDSNNISLYGTNSFNMVWEKVCQKVLGNVLDKKISELNEKKLLPYKYNDYEKYGKKKLIELIDKPEWTFTKWGILNIDDEEKNKNYIKKNTLKPDLIVFHKKNFIVLDAKYYIYKINENKNKLSKQPGIESVTKQYLYQLAYKDFIIDAGFEKSKNGFLFPSNEENFENEGFVKLNFLSELVKENNKTFNDEEDIQLLMLPASKMYEYYLNNNPLDDLSELKIKGID